MPSRSPITAQRRWLDLLQPAIDAGAILFSLAAVTWITKGGMSDTALAAGLVSVVIFLLVSQLTGLTQRLAQGSANSEMTSIVSTWAVTVLALAVLGFATRYGQYYARSVIFAWAILAPASIGLGRMCMRILMGGLLSHGYGSRRVAIAGFNPLGHQTAENISSSPSLGLNVVGYYDDRIDNRDNEDASIEFSGGY